MGSAEKIQQLAFQKEPETGMKYFYQHIIKRLLDFTGALIALVLFFAGNADGDDFYCS
jgi:lipopolysaccharide/colanic/teichoic acid biosynthesis glycosyltransferase